VAAGQPDAGGQAANLERKGDLETEHRSCRSIDTSRPARAALVAVREKVTDGAPVHRRSKVGSESPKEASATGHGRWLGLNTRASAADPDPERGPEVDATWLGVVGQPATETRRQRREDKAADEAVLLGRGRNPGAGILDVAAG
jgi:hypothetical protein